MRAQEETSSELTLNPAPQTYEARLTELRRSGTEPG